MPALYIRSDLIKSIDYLLKAEEHGTANFRVGKFGKYSRPPKKSPPPVPQRGEKPSDHAPSVVAGKGSESKRWLTPGHQLAAAKAIRSHAQHYEAYHRTQGDSATADRHAGRYAKAHSAVKHLEKQGVKDTPDHHVDWVEHWKSVKQGHDADSKWGPARHKAFNNKQSDLMRSRIRFHNIHAGEFGGGPAPKVPKISKMDEPSHREWAHDTRAYLKRATGSPVGKKYKQYPDPAKGSVIKEKLDLTKSPTAGIKLFKRVMAL